MYLKKMKQISNTKNYNVIHYKLHVDLENKKDKSQRALYDLYLKELEQKCYCEHDCCGHWFSTFISAERRGSAIFMKVGYAPNY